ncbi:SMEK domain-containing protein [Frisingicoccus sp.]|uniref:SMEK domain-containing protein n=1 Tax=Frisingicoccus sp. TaxID=1918627 RepID=UPI003AB4F7D5
MRKITKRSIRDEDIDIGRISKRLEEIAAAIKMNNKNNLTDINVICEEIFGRILDRLYDIHLVSLSAEVSGNFIAVDLIDYENRIAFQVTSRDDREKIEKTIEKFNGSDLIGYIDTLNILVLNSNIHHYREPDIVRLENGKEFSYSKNILNFNKLIEEIAKKNVEKNGFIVDVYDIINMVYDSGRLRYFSINRKTEMLMQTESDDFGDVRLWKKGYGDIQLTAYIPLSYEEEICCMMESRQHNISGVYPTFNQDKLLEDYFVSEEEFENKHNVGRFEDEEEIFMQIENMRICVNAHTAHHIYKLFEELKDEYIAAQNQIASVLGVEGLKKVGKKYLLMTIDGTAWKEILFFAKNHAHSGTLHVRCSAWARFVKLRAIRYTHSGTPHVRRFAWARFVKLRAIRYSCFKEDGEEEWNIFNNCTRDRVTLSPNVYGKIRGDILAEISVDLSEFENDKLNLYWSPGYKFDTNCMDCFDNVVKWKADYTKEWIENKLLKKAHDFWAEYHKRNSGWRRLFGVKE